MMKYKQTLLISHYLNETNLGLGCSPPFTFIFPQVRLSSSQYKASHQYSGIRRHGIAQTSEVRSETIAAFFITGRSGRPYQLSLSTSPSATEDGYPSQKSLNIVECQSASLWKTSTERGCRFDSPKHYRWFIGMPSCQQV